MQAPALVSGPGSCCRPALSPLSARHQRPHRPTLGWRPSPATSARLRASIGLTPTTATTIQRCSAAPHCPSVAAAATTPSARHPCEPGSPIAASRSFLLPLHQHGWSTGTHRIITTTTATTTAISSGRLPPCRALRTSSSSSRSSSGPQWAPNPMELVRREAGLQSNRLDAKLRERVEEAVERLGGRVTVGDVASRAGVKLADADEALKALAYDTQASLKVSSEGEVVYGFAPDFRSVLRNRSLLIAAAPQLRRLAGALSYLTRVAFGTTLIASVVVVWLAILALLSGRGDDRDDRRRGGGGMTFFMNPTDLFLFWDPSYDRKRARRSEEQGEEDGEMNFVEAVFSFVFGDGDPNEAFEERRWRELGAMIRKKSGVVTAEEMAPFLEPPPPAPLPRAGSREQYVPYPDESFVLPALIKFGGEPEVDEQGVILYRFPALQRTGVQQQPQRPQRSWRRGRDSGSDSAAAASWKVPLERLWELTAASPGQFAGVVCLGLFNLVGVGMLSGLLADPRGPALLALQGLGWITALMGPLRLYAGAFFAIPAFRWFLNQTRNRDISQRNEAREAAVEVITAASAAPRASPLRAITDKVAAARTLGEAGWAEVEQGAAGVGSGPRLVRDDEIVFDSGREVGGQADALDVDEWDRQLAAREVRERREARGRGGSGGGSGW